MRFLPEGQKLRLGRSRGQFMGGLRKGLSNVDNNNADAFLPEGQKLRLGRSRGQFMGGLRKGLRNVDNNEGYVWSAP